MRTIFRFILIILLGVVLPVVGLSQQLTKDSIEYLLERADDKERTPLSERLVILKQALVASRTIDYKRGIVRTQQRIGKYYNNLGKIDSAFTAFQESLQLAREIGDSLELAKTNYHYAMAYMRSHQEEKGLKPLEAALEYFENVQNQEWLAYTMVSIGSCYIATGKGEQGVQLYEEAYQILDSMNLPDRVVPIFNMSYYYLKNKQAEPALPFIQEALAIYEEQEDHFGITLAHLNMCDAYFQLGKYNKSLNNCLTCKEYAQKHNFLSLLTSSYLGLSDSYEALGMTQDALEAYKQYHTHNDSIISLETNKQISELEIKYETVKKDQALEMQKAAITKFEQQAIIDRQHKILLIGGALIFIGYGLFIYKKVKSDNAKRQEIYLLEKELIESKLKQEEAENENMQNELTYKTKYLTNFALEIAHKNQFSDELINGLKSLRKLSADKKEAKIKELIMMTHSHLQPNEEIDAFQDNIEKLNYTFYQKLEGQFPQLTNNDRILCGLIRLNIQSKEIASIRSVSNDAVKMARYRLRKKLGLKPEDDLVQFLQNV